MTTTDLATLVGLGVTLLGGGSVLGWRFGTRRERANTRMAEAKAEAAAVEATQAQAALNASNLANSERVIGILREQIDREERARGVTEARMTTMQTTIDELRARVRSIETKEHDCQRELADVRAELAEVRKTSAAAVAL
jgi:chromosome segregation ATPase